VEIRRAPTGKTKFCRFICLAVLIATSGFKGEIAMTIKLENEYVKYVIGPDGRNLHFIDQQTGKDYRAQDLRSACARIKIAGQYHDASSASYSGGRIDLQFGDSGVSAVVGIKVEKHYLVLEVLSVNDDSSQGSVEEFVFANIQLTLQGNTEKPFAGCALALNLQTNVVEIPQASSRLRAMCYPRFGFAGAQVAIIGCPRSELRSVMKEVVSAAPDLPKSSIGGPWALDAEINRGSYMFNFGRLSEETVDDWIRLAQKLGVSQIDFHGGNSFRFGDCRPNPETYPRGLDSLRTVIDRLHNAGILAGLHTYAFFIDKRCPWVTPVPDPRLAKDATFTLAEPLTSEVDAVSVIESTQEMSTITGFFVRNSVTIQIDDELITYKGISKEPPYAFTECQRGAYGTRAAPHAAGAKVHHLKECFGLFVPDPDSTLLEEVAASAANMYNKCGFDMMYLDALDGEDVLGGGENGWHYGSKFVFELWKRLEKPAIMEMSTFHHHLWFVRARMGAWDHPTRSHKKFIDIHCAANEELKRMFLPGHLGWWAVKTWSGAQGEPTFADDIEYLCCKCIGTDAGFSIMGITPDNISEVPVYERLAAIMRQYEQLRHVNYFSEPIKARLRVPGDEFALIQNSEMGKIPHTPGKGEWQFQPVQYAKHKVEGINGWSNVWNTRNRFSQQPLQLRIEALMSAEPYDAPGNVTLADFSDVQTDLFDRATAPGVTADLKSSSDHGEVAYSASSSNPNPRSAWARVGKQFSPTLDLSGHQGLGVWVYGDGQGEVLNFQLRSPQHISHGIGEHYVIVNFTGWRYFELIEPEGERYSQYSWPYGSAYAVYRESVNYGHIESLNLWYNGLPVGETATCYLRPIKALRLVNAKLINPAITIGTKTVVFPTEMDSGCYLEFHSMSDCKLYGPQGELIRELAPQGEVPSLEEGDNQMEFTCDDSANISARANVTVISKGTLLQ
jgi:hypothetical protein